MLQGKHFGNAFSEKGSKNVAYLTTMIEFKSDHAVINGRKFFATGALLAHWVPVVAVNDGKPYAALVPQHTPGLTIINDWSGFWQRTTVSGSVLLDNVQVDLKYIVPIHQAFGFGQKTTGSGTLEIKHVTVSRDHILPFDQRFKYQTAFYQVVHLATLAGIGRSAVGTFSDEVRKRTRIYSHGNAELVRDDARFCKSSVKHLRKHMPVNLLHYVRLKH